MVNSQKIYASEENINADRLFPSMYTPKDFWREGEEGVMKMYAGVAQLTTVS